MIRVSRYFPEHRPRCDLWHTVYSYRLCVTAPMNIADLAMWLPAPFRPLAELALQGVTLSGVLGGIWFLVKEFRSGVRVLVHACDSPAEPFQGRAQLNAELESHGDRETSLLPRVHVSGYTPKRKFQSCELVINEPQNRKLPSFENVHVLALGERGDIFLAGLLLVEARFYFTRGRSVRYRARSFGGERLGPMALLIQRLRFRFLGKY